MHALSTIAQPDPRHGVVLLGVGTVGSAFLARWAGRHAGSRGLVLVAAGDSRRMAVADTGLDATCAVTALLRGACAPRDPADVLAHFAQGTVVDATASDAVAAHHARWLARGLNVVTANKLGGGASLERWRDIEAAILGNRARYGDSATVGAGLPVLRTLRALRDGGDAIHGVAGVLSGSLAWLFGAFDGLRPFSTFVRQAREAGYTEPDPREDLSGADVRRKLLILARAAGHALRECDVRVDSLIPPALAAATPAAVDGALHHLDRRMRAHYARAWRQGLRLRHVARLSTLGGRVAAGVGIEALAPDDALCGGGGADNRVAIHCDRYRERPLVIQGAGAGAEVTAAALLDDVLAIARG